MEVVRMKIVLLLLPPRILDPDSSFFFFSIALENTQSIILKKLQSLDEDSNNLGNWIYRTGVGSGLFLTRIRLDFCRSQVFGKYFFLQLLHKVTVNGNCVFSLWITDGPLAQTNDFILAISSLDFFI